VESEREHTDARQRYRTRACRFEAPSSEGSAENFLRCIRTQEKPVLDGELGYRAQVAVSLGAMAFRRNRVTFFDPVRGKVIDTQPSAEDRTWPRGRRRKELQPGIAVRIANIPASAARQAGQRPLICGDRRRLAVPTCVSPHTPRSAGSEIARRKLPPAQWARKPGFARSRCLAWVCVRLDEFRKRVRSRQRA